MKFPNHILLDISKKNVSFTTQYWIFKYLSSLKKSTKFIYDFSFQKKFFFKKETIISNKLLINQKKFTIKYNYSNEALFLTKLEKENMKKMYQPRPKVKHKPLEPLSKPQVIYDFIVNTNRKYDTNSIKKLFRTFSPSTNTNIFKSNNLWFLFNINFLRKERIYTKLKYSRVPQYDIVSGGAAALLAGFLGFLICEKFGFELVDSGDFYFVFMYLVFFFFSLRLFLKITDFKESSWNAVSLKWLIHFYKLVILMFIKSVRNLFIFFRK